MYRQPVLIYNPFAGKIRRNPERILQRTIAVLRSASLNPRLLPTQTAGHGQELAAQVAAQGADLIVALGGDGTINEIANGLVGSDTTLGILPGGTANVLANELGLGSSLQRAAERLTHCRPTRISVGLLTTSEGLSRYFLCMAGAGLDAKIVSRVRVKVKARTGKLAYWMAGLAQFPRRLEQLDVSVEGKLFHCGFALASRVRNYGGILEIARGASLHRDDFELVLFEGSNPLRYAWYMLGVGIRRVQRMQGVRTIRTESAEIVSAGHLQIDGEHAGQGPARLQIVPKALSLLLPPGY